MRLASRIVLLALVLWPATAAADPPPNGVEFINFGIEALGLSAIAGAASVGCEEVHGSGYPVCQGITVGSAITLLVAAIPLFVIGVKRHDEWSRKRPVLVTPRSSVGVVGWTF